MPQPSGGDGSANDFLHILDGDVRADGGDEDGGQDLDEQPVDGTLRKPDESTTQTPRSTVRNSGMQFVATPSLPYVCIGLRRVCTPVWDMMYDSVFMGGVGWENIQYAKNCRGEREYRATTVAVCKVENDALACLSQVMLDVQGLEVIPAEHRTVNFRNDHSKMIGALSCAIKKNIRTFTSTSLEWQSCG